MHENVFAAWGAYSASPEAQTLVWGRKGVARVGKEEEGKG